MTLFRRALYILALLVLVSAPALAQDTDPGPSASTARTPLPPTAPQEVSIGVGFSGVFGVGNTVRPGDWAGLLLVINDSHDQPRNLAVRVSMPDPDGDTIERQRVIASTPGRDQSVWMYVRLPFSFTSNSLITVSVHEVPGEALGAATQVGRTLSWTRIKAQNVIESEDSMIGVIGRGQYGLDQYELSDGRGNNGVRTSHEVIHIISGVTPASMPDQWLGLLPFESLIWSDPPPRELGESPNDPRPRALRDWVRAGGHLVILLPSVGETWFTPSNPVADLLPDVRPRRVEGANYEAYRLLLSNAEGDQLPLPENQVIQVFETNASAASEDAIPILNGPDGTIAVRKLVGTGMVTVIGLDITDRRLQSSIFAADAFWHRVLGKRFDLGIDREKEKISSAILATTQRIYTDGYIEPGIRMSGTAAAGVLLGLVVFALYWVLAGPGGFGILKWRGLTRHAWLGFVAMIAMFAAITWIGSRATRPTSREARHVTYLDHVYGQEVQRARVWATIMLPTYDDQRIALAPSGETPDQPLALSPFGGAARTEAMTSFPDARAYVMDIRHPEEVTVPARSTSKTFQFEWLGVSRARGWGMPTPDAGDPLRIDGDGRLVGSLSHSLPGPLTNVKVILVERQLTPRQLREARRIKVENPMPSVASDWAFAPGFEWKPGEALDLAVSLKDIPPGRSIGAREFGPSLRGGGDAPSRVDSFASTYHYANSIYSMLTPPKYRSDVRTTNFTITRPLRRMTHGMDLSKWFTEPCVIVVGEIENTASPVPIYAGSPGSTREVPTKGRTIIRWVYPLTPNPPVFTEINR